MNILAIESSCDETSVAVVKDGREVLSNVIASSADLQSQFGGVVPEIAAREHVKVIAAVIEQALEEAHCKPETDIDAFAVTAGPGLAGALLVGVSAAKALAFAYKKPLYPVHHLAGHICANFLSDAEFDVPFTGLIVSGGHSHLVTMDQNYDFQILGRTLDDACGEAFDKIARALGKPYPGGPQIDKLAKTGDNTRYAFPTAHLKNNSDFSFSGLKTAALTYINKAKQTAEREGCEFTDILNINDFAASFQTAIVQTLVKHSKLAILQTGAKIFGLAGGVAANNELRQALADMCKKLNVHFTCPDKILCTDNGAMIGASAYYLSISGGKPADSNLNAYPSWSLDQWKKSPQVKVHKKL